jgi:UDP-glucose 4-epimerase
MSKILITGGAGFIGNSLAEKLLENKRNKIVIIDNLSTGITENIPRHRGVLFIKADVNKYDDIAPIISHHNFNYVFHFAAVVGIERTLKYPTMVLDDIDGIRNVLNFSKNTGVKRVLFSSSSEVYGEPFETPQKNEEITE